MRNDCRPPRPLHVLCVHACAHVYISALARILVRARWPSPFLYVSLFKHFALIYNLKMDITNADVCHLWRSSRSPASGGGRAMGEQAVSKRWKKRCIKGAQNGAKKVRKRCEKQCAKWRMIRPIKTVCEREHAAREPRRKPAPSASAALAASTWSARR